MNRSIKRELENTESKPAAKKSYKSPELVVYGDVRNLTKTVATSGGLDGGGAGTSKTH